MAKPFSIVLLPLVGLLWSVGVQNYPVVKVTAFYRTVHVLQVPGRHPCPLAPGLPLSAGEGATPPGGRFDSPLARPCVLGITFYFQVFRIRIRLFLDLSYPHPDPLVKNTGPDPALDPDPALFS